MLALKAHQASFLISISRRPAPLRREGYAYGSLQPENSIREHFYAGGDHLINTLKRMGIDEQTIGSIVVDSAGASVEANRQH